MELLGEAERHGSGDDAVVVVSVDSSGGSVALALVGGSLVDGSVVALDVGSVAHDADHVVDDAVFRHAVGVKSRFARLALVEVAVGALEFAEVR